jgi:gliding motility-associated protein GldM
MDRLGTDVGASKLNVDKIRPVVKANSKRVVAGTKYEGEMFMAAFNSTFKPQMTFNGENIDPSSQGIAAISFKASGGNYDENGQSKRVWKGTITYPKADGTDTTYIVEEEYTVLKPTILTQTSEKPPLFRNSGNKVSIQVPALGADYNPEFQVSGGKIRNRQGTGNVTIIPTDPNAKVKIYNNGTYIGEEKFDVRLIPTPDILLKKGQADYTVNYIRGVPRSHLNALYVGVKPDKEFKKVCPNDAQYKFYEISATVVRNGIPRHSETLRHYQTFAALASHLNLGDNLIIEVKDLRRKNYLGEIERVNIPSTVFNLPIR